MFNNITKQEIPVITQIFEEDNTKEDMTSSLALIDDLLSIQKRRYRLNKNELLSQMDERINLETTIRN